MKFFDKEFVRFILFGFVNTAAGYLFYLTLLLFLPYIVSYALSYVLGIALSYWLYSRFVFKTKIRVRTAVQYPLVYVLQYGLGVGALYLLVELLHVAEFIAPALVLLVTIPITFLASRFIIKGQRSPE